MKLSDKIVARMRRIGKLVAVLVSLIAVTGCWDEVNLQDVSYLSALGIDYEEGQFILYGQMINFASVAKTEAPGPGPVDTWIGVGKGNTMHLAYNDLVRAGYTLLNIEHLKTVLIRERALGYLEDVLDGLNRQRASRYTCQIYGTTVDIMDVLNTETFFNQSPLYSALYMPGPHSEQYTFLEPLQMQLLVQTMKEPNEITLLPVINNSTTHWTKGNKKMSTQLVTGAFVFKDFEYKGYYKEKSISGIRWLNPEFHNAVLEAKSGENKGTVSINRVVKNLDVSMKGDTPIFSLNIKLSGSLIEKDGDITMDQIESSIQDEVHSELTSLYNLGVKQGIDFLELEHYLYRHHYSYWKKVMQGQSWVPDSRTLKEINVKFKLINSGKFDLKERG
ncbi:Ger(x)C family spore germination protein [Paenibacillus sp. strain BS8-2]